MESGIPLTIEIRSPSFTKIESGIQYLKFGIHPPKFGTQEVNRMKACIDECQPNTSQTNYSEGFWRITSKINAKIEVRKQLESVHANRRSPTLCHMFLKRRRFPSRFAFASLFAVKFLLILMNSISKFMSACL